MGHALLILSVGALTYAARLPSLRREALERRVAEANADVRILRAAAERFRLQQGRWPAGDVPGTAPAELIFELPRDFDPRGDGYAVQWTRLERLVRGASQGATPAVAPEPGVTRTIASPSRPATAITEIGAITVVSRNSSLLAALHRDPDPGRETSFIADSTWTLLVSGATRP